MTSAGGESDGIVAFVDGDLRAAQLLRSSLATLRDRLGDDPDQAGLRRDITSVLEGRMSMRELSRVPELRAIADRGMSEVQAAWDALAPEDRARQVAAGRALDAEAPPPGSPTHRART